MELARFFLYVIIVSMLTPLVCAWLAIEYGALFSVLSVVGNFAILLNKYEWFSPRQWYLLHLVFAATGYMCSGGDARVAFLAAFIPLANGLIGRDVLLAHIIFRKVPKTP